MNNCLLVLVATTCIVATACSSSTKPADPDNGNKTETGFKVGDYYNHGLIKGIVFSIDETGEHGMIVSLDENSKGTVKSELPIGSYYV